MRQPAAPGGTADRRSDVEQWYERYHARLLGFLRRSLRAECDAQDVSQEVYLRLLRIPKDRVVEHPKAYLFRVAVNVVNDWRSSKTPFESCGVTEVDELESGLRVEEDYDGTRRMERIDEALRALPPHYRATILLKAGHGLTYGEIARQLGVSERMVKRYIVKGYARLREKLSVEACGDRS